MIMLPAVAWWTGWSHGHMTHSQDVVSLYYTNYLGYQIYNVGWRDLPLVFWKNLDGVFTGIAGLMIFDLGKTAWGIFLSRFLAIAAIAGTVRLAKQRGVTPYHGFAAAYVAILLVWHYPPNERFMLPVFPVVLAGLGCELARLGPLGLANRVAGVAMAGGLAALACFGLAMNGAANFLGLPGIIERTARSSRLIAWRLTGSRITSLQGTSTPRTTPCTPAGWPAAYRWRQCLSIAKTARRFCGLSARWLRSRETSAWGTCSSPPEISTGTCRKASAPKYAAFWRRNLRLNCCTGGNWRQFIGS